MRSLINWNNQMQLFNFSMQNSFPKMFHFKQHPIVILPPKWLPTKLLPQKQHYYYFLLPLLVLPVIHHYRRHSPMSPTRGDRGESNPHVPSRRASVNNKATTPIRIQLYDSGHFISTSTISCIKHEDTP